MPSVLQLRPASVADRPGDQVNATPIPASSRKAVIQRASGLCERCGAPGHHWHHRRSRSVRDALTHSPANGVLLCSFDHAYVHAKPAQAKEEGFIVSRYQDPRLVPINRWDGAMVYLNDDGTVTF